MEVHSRIKATSRTWRDSQTGQVRIRSRGKLRNKKVIAVALRRFRSFYPNPHKRKNLSALVLSYFFAGFSSARTSPSLMNSQRDRLLRSARKPAVEEKLKPGKKVGRADVLGGTSC